MSTSTSRRSYLFLTLVFGRLFGFDSQSVNSGFQLLGQAFVDHALALKNEESLSSKL
jgi:hypothetical protein